MFPPSCRRGREYAGSSPAVPRVGETSFRTQHERREWPVILHIFFLGVKGGWVTAGSLRLPRMHASLADGVQSSSSEVLSHKKVGGSLSLSDSISSVGVVASALVQNWFMAVGIGRSFTIK